MNIVVKSALASAALAFAYACATPIEIEDDVQTVNPNAFGDAGVFAGAGGGAGQSGASQGGTGAGLGGTASGTGGVGGAGVAGMPVGSSGSSGLPSAGAGGSGAGGVGGTAGGSGGAAGTAAGAGGAAGTAGSAGAAGSGGTGSSAVFDPGSCDFVNTAGCETLTCQARCPTNDGNSCLNRCVAVIECVSDDVASNPDAPCVTEADPLCGARDGGQPRACTTVVEPAGGPNPNPPSGTQAPQPSFVARAFTECICSLPRP